METKKWWQSRAVWGGIIAVISGVIGVFGKQIPAETQEFLSEQAVNIATAIGTVFGGVLAVYGRIRADKLIK